MRKLLLLLGWTPAKIEKLTLKALSITTKAIRAVNGKIALTITYLVPGEKDEALRLAVSAALNVFKDALERETGKQRKLVAKDMAVYITASLDGGKSDPKDYGKWVQKTYDDNKEQFKVA